MSLKPTYRLLVLVIVLGGALWFAERGDERVAQEQGPVFPRLDPDGITHNVNADEAAGAIARALHAEKLILLTDVEGVKDGDGTVMNRLVAEEARKLIEVGTIREGMIPKVECCIEALEGDVASTTILDGRVQHAILLEIFTDGGVGTLLTR